MTLAVRGEFGPASGWFGRAQRLVEREGRDCVEQGWLLVPVVFQLEAAGDHDGADETAARAVEIAERFDDPDLAAIALHARGLSRIKRGSIDEGLGLTGRGDGGCDGRPGVADRRGRRLLRGDRGLRGGVRATPRAGVDKCVDALGRGTAANGLLHGQVSRAPSGADAVPRQVARRPGGGEACPPTLRGGDEPSGDGAGPLSAGRAASPPGRLRVGRDRRTATGAATAASHSRAWHCCDSRRGTPMQQPA